MSVNATEPDRPSLPRRGPVSRCPPDRVRGGMDPLQGYNAVLPRNPKMECDAWQIQLSTTWW